MGKGFRIIGIKVLDGCNSGIKKNLLTGKLYSFCKDYKPIAGSDYALAWQPYISADIDSIYNVINSEGHQISVNVNAIVGKNGDGKSTIVEIMLRILNNFAYYYGFLNDHDSLMCVKGLRAILYYEVNGKVYALVSDSDACPYVYCNGAKLDLGIEGLKSSEAKKMIKEKLGSDLFYTLIVNYSLYAYNSTLLKDENDGEKCWIQSLFHKNDAYQTPIVLNPMRSEGNINVNKEESLAKQRLLALYVMSGSNSGLRTIGENCIAEGFAYRIEPRSKFDAISITRFFRENRSKHLAWVEAEQAFNRERPEGSLKPDKAKDVCDKFMRFWTSFVPWFDQQPNLQKQIKAERHYMEYNHNNLSDLADYMLLIHKWIGELRLDYDKHHVQYIDVFAGVSTLNWLSYAQLYRILVIKTVWETLEENTEGVFDYSLDKALGATDDLRASAMKYAVYKVISILETYQKFGEETHVWDSSYAPICYSLDNNPLLDKLRTKVLNVLSVDDYTTLKLRQTLHYLKESSKKGCVLINRLKGIKREDEGGVLSGSIAYIGQKYSHYITFEQLHKNIVGQNSNPKLSEIAQHLPPPIFDGEIILRGKGLFPISQLSSGQIQMLYSVSTFIYHLRNINYSQEGGMIEYKHINAIFEEVELYFHPEYQKQFVKFLLDQIKGGGLDNIESINISLVTHSPFVLSDVLRKNILYLKDGADVSDEIPVNPFGANINEVLHQSFFLQNGFLGAFSSDRILSLGRWLKGLPETETWDEDVAKSVIDSIQEPYIKKQLLSLWDRYYMENKQPVNLISDLEKQVAVLNERIRELKQHEKNSN